MAKSVAVAIAIALLAGCGGANGQLNPALGQSQISPDMSPDTCRHVGIISISPCSVDFTNSRPGPDTVRVTIHGHINGTVVQSNNCGGASGIARVVRRSNLVFKIVAGSSSGSCKVKFRFFHNGSNDGYAILNVTNSM